MNLKKKEEFKPRYEEKPKEFKKTPPVDWSKYEIDYNAKVPHGKYTGSVVRQVMNLDQWYWDWMRANNIFAAWGLIKEIMPATPKKNKNYDPFLTEDGETWLCIYEIPANRKEQ